MALRHCPFCASTNTEIVDGMTHGWSTVRCRECGAQGPQVRKQQAGVHPIGTIQAAWDRRKHQKKERAGYP